MNPQEARNYAEALAQIQAAQVAIFNFEEAERGNLTEFVVKKKVSIKQHLADILARSAAIRGISQEGDDTEYRINSALREELTPAVKALMLISDQKDVFSVKANASGAGTMYMVGIDMIRKPKYERAVELIMDNGDSKSFHVQVKSGYYYFRALDPYTL